MLWHFLHLVFAIVWTICIFKVSWDFLVLVIKRLFLFALLKSLLLLALLLFATFRVNSAFHSQLTSLKLLTVLFGNCFLHSFFCFKHHVAYALSEISLAIPDKSDIFYVSASLKKRPDFFLWHYKRNIANKHSGFVIWGFRGCRVNPEVLVLKLNLVQGKSCSLCGFFSFEKYICILVVFLCSEVASNDLRAFRSLRLLSCRHWSEPNLLDLSMNLE